MARSLKTILAICAVLAVAAALWWAFRERPISVETARTTRGPMAVTIEEDGQTRVREIYRVSSPITGNVGRSLLNVGDRVKAGETVVATISPLQPAFMDERTRAEARALSEAARAAIGVAQAELAQARAAHDLAKAELARAQRLAESRTISQASLEKARTDADLKDALARSAEAAVALRRSELASANARLMQPGDRALLEPQDKCCVNVTAPIDGVVLGLAVKSEQVIEAGAPLAEIGDPGDLEVVVDLLSSDAVRIATGSQATIGGWGGEPIAGKVRSIDPAGFTKVSALGIEEQRVNAVIDIDERRKALGHGFQVRVALEVWRADDVLQVPVAALFRQGSDWAIFAVEEGRARLHKVEVGHMNGEAAQVTGGIDEGRAVIVFPSDTVADGTLVTSLN